MLPCKLRLNLWFILSQVLHRLLPDVMITPTSGRALCGLAYDLKVVSSVFMAAPQRMRKRARCFSDDAQASSDSEASEQQ
eukprot:6141531-Amphidinium_carterae.1